MSVLILVRILVWVRMLDRASSGFRFQDDPGAIAFFQIVRDLHACAGGGSGLGTEFDFGMCLIAFDGNAVDVHLHGSDVERANGGQGLRDAGAGGVRFARLLLASPYMGEGAEKQNALAQSLLHS